MLRRRALRGSTVHTSGVKESVIAILPSMKSPTVSKLFGGEGRPSTTVGPLIDTVYMGPFSAPDIPSDARGYIYQMRCSAGNVYLWMILNSDGKIATIFFKDKLDVETVERPGQPDESPAPSSPKP